MTDADIGSYRIVSGRMGWRVYVIEEAAYTPEGKVEWRGVGDCIRYASLEEARLAVDIELAKRRVTELQSALDRKIAVREKIDGSTELVIAP
jgi:hypothetical protein